MTLFRENGWSWWCAPPRGETGYRSFAGVELPEVLAAVGREPIVWRTPPWELRIELNVHD